MQNHMAASPNLSLLQVSLLGTGAPAQCGLVVEYLSFCSGRVPAAKQQLTPALWGAFASLCFGG
jgi:hypothetical protein